MSIIIELQQEALSKDSDLLSLLRKAYLVARKLKLKDFEEWIDHELNGYGVDDQIPKYRIYRGEIKAWNAYYEKWIPTIFENDFELSIHKAYEPIANLIDVYNNSGKLKVATVQFDDRINTILSEISPIPTKFCLQISINMLYSTFECIRNTILDWTITLEESGIMGEGFQFTADEVKVAGESNTINKYFTNNFYGNVNNTQVQQGTEGSQQEHE